MTLATPVISGEVKDFETALRGTHADYRIALFMTKRDGSRLRNLYEQAAVLKSLAEQTLAHPPPEAKDDVQFVKLSENVVASVEILLSGLRANDTKAVTLEVSQLKPAYAKLFVKFG